MELIREILLWVEAQPANQLIHDIEVSSDRSTDEILGHLRLMQQAALFDGEIEFYESGIYIAIHGLSNEGHDLLDSIRSEKIWNQTQERLKSIGGSVGIEVLKTVAKAITLGTLGL